MQISINQQAYQLAFGFGMLRKLGELHGLDSYSKTLELLQSSFEDLENITFEKEDLLKNLIYASALHAKDENAKDLQDFSMIDYIIENQDEFSKIVEAVMKSFPGDLGKQKARKPQKPRSRTVKKNQPQAT